MAHGEQMKMCSFNWIRNFMRTLPRIRFNRSETRLRQWDSGNSFLRWKLCHPSVGMIWEGKSFGGATLITFMEISATIRIPGEWIKLLDKFMGQLSERRKAFRIELSIYGFLNGWARNSCDKSVINLWKISDEEALGSISRRNVKPIVSIPDSLAKAKLEDCEKPPEVENASVVVAYDENEEFVTATYRCHEGFKLSGKKDVTCDLDTDEWQESPPSCEAGNQSAHFIFSKLRAVWIKN